MLETVSDKKFLRQVNEKGNLLRERLSTILSGNDSVDSIRGNGLMIGIRFKQDPAEIIKKCADEGLLLIKAGHNTVRFMPPLTVTKGAINKAVTIFKKVINNQL